MLKSMEHVEQKRKCLNWLNIFACMVQEQILNKNGILNNNIETSWKG